MKIYGIQIWYKWEDNPIYLDKSAVFIQRIFHTFKRLWNAKSDNKYVKQKHWKLSQKYLQSEKPELPLATTSINFINEVSMFQMTHLQELTKSCTNTFLIASRRNWNQGYWNYQFLKFFPFNAVAIVSCHRAKQSIRI